MLSNGHAGFGGRPEETDQPKGWHRASGRPNRSEGKNHNEAMRCLKRRLSDIVYRQLIGDAVNQKAGPGGHSGAALSSRAAS